MIFPEGTIENERRIRFIKTGAARIALGTAKENNYSLNMKILPVGLNYTMSSKFRSELSIAFGKPLETNDFIEAYQNNETTTARALTLKIEESIKALVINIDQEEHNEFIEKLEIIYKTELTPSRNLPTEISQKIVKGVKYFQLHNHDIFNETKFKIDNYFEKLEQVKIADIKIGESDEKPTLFLMTIEAIFKLIFGLPL